MDKKTTGIIATIASVLLCGCPGIFLCLFGALTATGNGTFNDQYLQPTYGYVLLCLSLIFIIIPVVVGVVTLRKKPQLPVDNEPLPPAS
jgi:integral membrane sensor domain MASE1